jgi:molybdopterin biosynthesis enzyme
MDLSGELLRLHDLDGDHQASLTGFAKKDTAVAVKPGKPTLFARRDDAWIFGLPGNPVSAFVIFEVFVRPFLYRRMGIDVLIGVGTHRLLTRAEIEDLARRGYLEIQFLGQNVNSYRDPETGSSFIESVKGRFISISSNSRILFVTSV